MWPQFRRGCRIFPERKLTKLTVPSVNAGPRMFTMFTLTAPEKSVVAVVLPAHPAG